MQAFGFGEPAVRTENHLRQKPLLLGWRLETLLQRGRQTFPPNARPLRAAFSVLVPSITS